MKSFGLTNIGNYRLKNDDSFFVSDGLIGIYIVADGMGGYKGGEIASKLAVSTSVQILNEKNHLDQEVGNEIIREIQAKFQREINKNRSLKDMGTTLICCYAVKNHLSFMHVGDSRAYHITNDEIRQLTEDHTLVNVLYKSGMIKKEELKNHPQKNVLMKTINAFDVYDADYFELELLKDEFILLCSDGLTDMIQTDDMKGFFDASYQAEEIAKNLVERAIQNGGKDNIAVVVIKG
ncbi:Stp1/IreP family PP2C-type Ser/Thr phosphatase [Guggenheimella bovis]